MQSPHAVLPGFVLSRGLPLQAMRSSIPTMQVTGGQPFILIAADMVMGWHALRTSPEEKQVAAHQADTSPYPRAIPLIAGPGSMTSLVMLRQQAGDDPTQVAVLLTAPLIALGATLMGAAQVTRALGAAGTNAAGRC